MDILFFHCLQRKEEADIHIETWRSSCANRSVWLKEWLPKEFPEARIFTISYDGSMKKNDTRGRIDLYLVGESLLGSLLLAGIGQVRPVILIGHGFGGLVIKQLCLLAHKASNPQAEESHGETHGQEKQALLKNIEGIFYYSTPHLGSKLTNKEEEFDIMEGELVQYLRVFSKDLARLNQEFEILRNDFRWDISGVGETLPTDLGGRSVLLVEEASARCYNFTAVLEDHISICKPKDKESTTYQVLVNFIRTVQLKVVSSRYNLQSDAENLQPVPKTLVGAVGSFAEGEIYEKLKSSPVLGLWGMGGVGKTTLSKVAFNYLHHLFEYTVFVENIKLLPGQQKDIERTILEELHHWGRKVDKDIPDVTRLRGKSLLVVLDDVEQERDFAVVSKLRPISSASSGFILTARDKHILALVDDTEIVAVGILDDVSSETLFKSYAISPRNRALLDWQQDCVERIIKACGGLPLVLEVLGKYLRGTEDRDVCEQVQNSLVKIDKGKTTGMDEVWVKLKVSYDSLEDDEKRMFRDAATFFQDGYRDWYIKYSTNNYKWTLNDARAVWRANDEDEALHWRTLVERALVYDGPGDSPIKLHEHFRTLGQRLAEGMGEIVRIKPSRGEDDQKVFDLLGTFCNGTKPDMERLHTVQLLLGGRRFPPSCFSCRLKQLGRKLIWCSGLIPPNCKHGLLSISMANLHKMEQLQYLQFVGCRLAARKVVLPCNLLVFVGGCDGKNLLFDASPNLVILSVYVFGEKLVPHSMRNLKNLYSLRLTSPTLKCLPKSFGCLSRLQKCDLFCPVLRGLPESFVRLTCLQQLSLTSCGLERLPDSFGALGNLQELSLNTNRLERLPDSFGSLGKLKKLALSWNRLEMLPDSFASLGSLHEFTFYCNRLERLPDSFGTLESLQKLTLDCDRLERLPNSFGNLGSLQEFTLGSCRLERLPNSFGNLRSLQELKLISHSLDRLPDSFVSLRGLQELTLGSHILERLLDSFGSLGSLQELTLYCDRLEKLPNSFGGLGNLQELRLFSERLESLPDSFGSLENLQALTLSSFRLERLPDSFGDLGSLQDLRLFSERLERLPDSFGSLRNLQQLGVRCSILERLPDSFGSLESLQESRLFSKRLEGLPDSFGSLESLQELTLESIRPERLPDSFGSLANLKLLSLCYCENLNMLSDSFIRMGRLDKAFIYMCEKLERFRNSCSDPLKKMLQVQVESPMPPWQW